MQIKVNVKQLGKKRPIIEQKILEIEPLIQFNLKELITHVVKQQVEVFNKKLDEKPIINFLLDKEIEEKKNTGKVGFGEMYNAEKANEKLAIENALQSFEDGIYCVFLDENQLENLNDTFVLNPDSTFTFVRLTFLSGMYY